MKVAVVGSGDERHSAPFDEPEWQIWVYAPNLDLPRVTVRFDVPKSYTNHDASMGWIFPAKQILADFGGIWLTSAPAWLMPFALTAGAKEIALYGLNLSELQLPAMHYWMWVAEQLRVDVSVPENSRLIQFAVPYGLRQRSDTGR